ncbi:MAG: WYL domain-containing protein [Phocaeicola sp.]
MKSHSIFKEYIWLLNTIYKAKNITLEEISQQWMKTEMSGGLPMPRSSFNRYKDAIEDIFDVKIECERIGGYKYYIGNTKQLEEDTIQNWMLSTLSVNNIISESRSVHDRIMLESTPSDGEHLRMVIDAMKVNKVIKIGYKKYNSDNLKEIMVEPYCVKLYHRRWYLLARYNDESHVFRTFSFDRILNLSVTDVIFKIDPEFKIKKHYHDSYGIVSGDGTATEQVVIRAFDTEGAYLRDLPIHASQKEIVSEETYSDFELSLRPTLDFKGYIVSRGSRIKVLKPEWLANEIRKMHEDAMNLYTTTDGLTTE